MSLNNMQIYVEEDRNKIPKNNELHNFHFVGDLVALQKLPHSNSCSCHAKHDKVACECVGEVSFATKKGVQKLLEIYGPGGESDVYTPRAVVMLRLATLFSPGFAWDTVPLNIKILCDGKMVKLPLCVRSELTALPVGRRKEPIDITCYLDLSKAVHVLQFNWPSMNAEYQNYYFTVELLRYENAENLRNIIVTQHRFFPNDTLKLMFKNCGDGDILPTSIQISLLCPLSRKRLIYPCRSVKCTHPQCFDVDNFLQVSKGKVYLRCPICRRTVHRKFLCIDLYEMFTLDILKCTTENVVDVFVFNDGTWKPAPLNLAPMLNSGTSTQITEIVDLTVEPILSNDGKGAAIKNSLRRTCSDDGETESKAHTDAKLKIPRLEILKNSTSADVDKCKIIVSSDFIVIITAILHLFTMVYFCTVVALVEIKTEESVPPEAAAVVVAAENNEREHLNENQSTTFTLDSKPVNDEKTSEKPLLDILKNKPTVELLAETINRVNPTRSTCMIAAQKNVNISSNNIYTNSRQYYLRNPRAEFNSSCSVSSNQHPVDIWGNQWNFQNSFPNDPGANLRFHDREFYHRQQHPMMNPSFRPVNLYEANHFANQRYPLSETWQPSYSPYDSYVNNFQPFNSFNYDQMNSCRLQPRNPFIGEQWNGYIRPRMTDFRYPPCAQYHHPPRNPYFWP
ncbi:E3 SUMO-protein ligase PIAS2 [Trichinella britovi]|uniref:E3 SUMO-protein ligase PIAS2 n=1 Tax=Trichinella britovi TaxID=45882 RepID=A0A0V1DG50_TRIBR|nr:E3 SUMO-protein ligase PIAS2 [Trichinella britovi]